MGYSISSNNEETNEEIYMYSNKKNTLLNNFSNIKEYKTKSFNLEKLIKEDKLKLNRKNNSIKTNNINIKNIRDKGYNADKNQDISRNNENKNDLKKIVNLKIREFTSNGVITSRILKKSNTIKKDINNFEKNVNKNNNLKIGIINEYRNKNEKSTKMTKCNTSNNLLYTYMNNKDIYKNKNIYDNHLLNFGNESVNNFGKYAFENKNITLESSKLNDNKKVQNFKLNNNLNNNTRENISNKNDCGDELNKSHINKCNSSIIFGNVNNSIINNNSTKIMFNKFNENLVNDYSNYHNGNNILFPNENAKMSYYNNFTYNDNILVNKKNCEDNNFDLYNNNNNNNNNHSENNNNNNNNNNSNSYNVNNNESEQKKMMDYNLYITTYLNMKNKLNSYKAKTDELNMKTKLKDSDYCKYLSHNNTVNKIEFLEKKIKNKISDQMDLNSQKNVCRNADFFNSNDTNKYVSSFHYNENVDDPNNFYISNILKEKIKKKNKHNLTVSQDFTIKKKEDILNFNKNIQYDLNSKKYNSLKYDNDSTYTDIHDYLNCLRNRRGVNTGVDDINAFCEYNNCENKKVTKNNIVESNLDNEEDYAKKNDIINMNNSKKKLLYIRLDDNENNCLDEKNHNYYMNIKMSKQECAAPHANMRNNYDHINNFKNVNNVNNDKYLIDSSHILLNENILNDNIVGINPILREETNNYNYLSYCNYLKRSSELDEKDNNNNITKKIIMYNDSDKNFNINNFEEKNHTSSSVSTYSSLNSNHIIKMNNENFSKCNKNINAVNLKNMNEINYGNKNKIKYKIINNSTYNDRKYNESNNYAFSEDIYFPSGNVIEGSLNNFLRDDYCAFDKNINKEKLKRINCIKNNYMPNDPLYISKDKKSEIYNNDKAKLLENNKKNDAMLHKNYTTNNFIIENENKVNLSCTNMNTINIPLNRNNATNNGLNKKFIPNCNIINNTNILNNKVADNISHTCIINKSIHSNSNNKLPNTCILKSTMHNGNIALNKNNISAIATNNNSLSNNISNKDVYNTCDILNGKMINNNTVILSNTMNNNILYNNKKTTLKVSKNENENFLSKEDLLNLTRTKGNNKEKELELCKSVNNSRVCNYLRNVDTKSLPKFHRTVSLRNLNLKKKKPVTATQENINNFKEDTFEIDTKYIVKKAVVIGCNYVNDEKTRLYGCVNDAYVFCRALVKYFDFTPENILLLTDSLPSDAYIYEDFDINRKKYIKETNNSSSDSEQNAKRNIFNLFNKSGMKYQNKKNVDINSCNSCKNFDIKNVDISSHNINLNLWPTRINILKAVNWLVRDSTPFGSYVFYFAGKSVQVDNMSGWEGEGYDEAFLCSDPFNKNSEHNVITAVQLKDLLLSVNSNSQMTIILDCSGGQTILDPAGTENSWSYIKGCKQKGIWPITNPTDKVHKAIYDITILNNSAMKKYFCKSRFSELIEVESTSAMIDPLLQSISSLPIAPKAYCLCAATWEQISIEGLFPIIEFARVTQLKKFNDYNDKKKNITKKKKKNSKEILSDVQRLNKKKSFYEKNFNFSLSMMKVFFNSNKKYSTEDKNSNKFEEKDKSMKLCADNSNKNDLRDSICSDSDSNSYMSSNTEDSGENANEDKDDNYILVSHGVFTYCFIEAIMEFKEKELKNNIFEKNNQAFLPMTLKNLINLIQQKIQNVKNNKLKKLNQKPEFTIHPGANASINNYFVHYSKNIHFQNNKCNFINSDLFPFLNVNKAWEEINKNTLRHKKSLSLSSTLINSASSKYFTEQKNQIKNSYSLRY
ncbi:metacaspase-like protein, putative [Plasmodium relictum]|uniref:Metacaspase-like protein, putative n=1 Tax=Plasmodium relictum TaxID=85471 RepID=A0A1J1HDV2_PLARL|nr:metacaspase-like protein, putative [Plasmodium relictum]CRH03975.1 metacaspase-like protein, putative [Plasmodium relictum]